MSRASTGLSSVDRRKFKPRQYEVQGGLCWIRQQPFPLAEVHPLVGRGAADLWKKEGEEA